MFYERIQERQKIKEKASDSDNEELSYDLSSEDFHKSVKNNEMIQNTGTFYNNFQKTNTDIIPKKFNLKDYFTPYISKRNNDNNLENNNKDNNYLTQNQKNNFNYEQKIFDYNENNLKKNDTEVQNYRTEENFKISNYQQNNTVSEYEIKGEDKKINNQVLSDKGKNTKRLNFSYDKNINNFDDCNKMRFVKEKKDYIRNEYNNITFNEKPDNNNTKNIEFGCKINNIKKDIITNNNNYLKKKINYIKDNNMYNNKENNNININNHQKKVESIININKETSSNFKNGSDIKILRKQILSKNYLNNEESPDVKEKSKKPNYYFSYDYSTNIKNYDNKGSAQSEYSTAIDTTKYKNYIENKNVEVKEFDISDETNQNENKNIEHIFKNNNNFGLTQKEQNYINNLKTLNSEIIKGKSKSKSIIKNYADKIPNKSNNNNENMNLEKRVKSYNSTNNLLVNDMNEKIEKKDNSSSLSSLLKKDYLNIKLVSAPNEHYINNKINNYENYIPTNTQENQPKNSIITPKRKEVNISYPNNQNSPLNQENCNLNTLESVMIRNMEEEEEIRTLELEKERKKLEQLEKEKQKLIFEENERREKIMIEIKRQEMEDLERKKLMRKQYHDKLRKKKEDEEKLLRIKEEQQKQIEEINALMDKRKYDEQKLLMLTEGKLNKRQRNDYIIGLRNNNFNSNKLPFKINIDENNNKFLIEKMKTNNITKSSNYWNYKNNMIENNENNSLDNSVENEENIIKDNQDFEEIENNSDEREENDNKSINDIEEFSENKIFKSEKDFDIEKNYISNFNNDNESRMIYKPKNKRIKINNNNPIIKETKEEFKTFSPKLTHKNDLSAVSTGNEFNKTSNKISSEIQDFSLNNIINEEKTEENKEINDINKEEYKIDNEIILEKADNSNELDNKNYYKKNKFSFNKRKDNKEKNLNGKDSKKSSFAKLNELREITSKLASEVEKKIQLINKNKLISKSKSSPKLAENYTKYDYKNYKMEIEIENKNNEEISIDKDKEKKESQTENDNLLSSKSYKYNQLIKDTKIEISNLINNSQSQSTKKKKLISENILPEELKNECISELKKIENTSKKKGKENMELNTEKVDKLLDNINRNKKKGIALKTYKTSINMNQKAFYNDYLYGNKKKIQGQEIDQKFLPYYKEIYGDGEATPEKDE